MKTVSLDLAKQLKEKGYPQEGYSHYWGGIGNWGLWCKHVIDDLDSRETRFKWVAAPTADEILDLLPFYTSITSRRHLIYGYKVCKYKDHTEKADTFADAVAKMWLYLEERKFIDLLNLNMKTKSFSCEDKEHKECKGQRWCKCRCHKPKIVKLNKKDLQGTYTVAVDVKDTEPISIESLEKIYTEAEVIPMKFKPTGEIVYVTAEMRDLMEAEKKKHPEFFKQSAE